MTPRSRTFLIPAHNARHFGAAGLALALLAGCSTPAVQKPDESRVKQFAGMGYQTDEHFGITTTYAAWVTAYLTLDVSLTVPARPGPVPLVIYLPALGETRSSGEVWRTAWAQSGYAVLSVQPLPEDARAWSTPRARSGDFVLLARERYSAGVMKARIEALHLAMTELTNRQSRGEAPLDKVDLSRVAIAGFDLGAYVAMVIAGEQVRGMPAMMLPYAVKAIIALSPYSDFSGVAFAERYAGIRGPVLSITSDSDSDPLGLVTSPPIRKAPFEYMPAGDKYLLTLSGVPHQTMSGGGASADAGDPGRNSGAGTRGQGGERQADGAGQRGHRKGGAGAGSPSEGGRQPMGGPPGEYVFSPTSRAISEAAIVGVTTAFLDSFVKMDTAARDWLDRGAPRWLRDRGEIKRK